MKANESKKVTRESYVAYGLRGPSALKAKCAAIAEAMTREQQVPVSVSAVMRKFILAGCDAWGREARRG